MIDMLDMAWTLAVFFWAFAIGFLVATLIDEADEPYYSDADTSDYYNARSWN